MLQVPVVQTLDSAIQRLNNLGQEVLREDRRLIKAVFK